jgi:SPP1 family predicted phage head-tail adaptor
MAIGNLDRRIVIQTSTVSRDAYGEAIPTWSTLRTVWAWIRPVAVSEGEKSNKITASDTVRFVVRYRSDYTEKMRIVYNSNTYEIKGIQEVGRREYQELTAERRY